MRVKEASIGSLRTVATFSRFSVQLENQLSLANDLAAVSRTLVGAVNHACDVAVLERETEAAAGTPKRVVRGQRKRLRVESKGGIGQHGERIAVVEPLLYPTLDVRREHIGALLHLVGQLYFGLT